MGFYYLLFGTLAATIFTLLGTIFYMVYGKFRVQENKIIAFSSSPQLSLSPNKKHHVFPSFHGTDVRKSFLSHILKEFRSKGIDPFIDNDIERSKSIGPELIEAIRGSKIAIVLLSKNYASSTWCMNELMEIMRCREELGQTVMTIFYEVDPTDVKKQTGDFGKIFRNTCKGKTIEDIKRWRHAFAEVAKIAGYHSNNWDDEAAMIETIATDISNKLNIATPSRDFDGLIGMEAHMENMKMLLRLDLDVVRMIGIWGPPGIGKTTIARFMFDKVSNNFQLSALMDNIKVRYPRPCLDEYNAQLQLQNQMLSQMLNQQDIMITHLGVAQERLKDKKVFIVLDDVDRLEQIVALAGETQWFGPGSRIIITTEDRRFLKAHGINHIYKVSFPSTDEALQIFCMNAFGQKSPKVGFVKLARKVTNLVGELPLGLKVMGSYFRRMSKHEWKNALPSLKTHLNGDIESVLQYSYDALCDDDKHVFLHIACFFNHEEIGKVVEHLSKRIPDVRQRLGVLVEKSLIYVEDSPTFIKYAYIRMHSLLVQLGKDIVRKKSIHEPGRRQFLVDSREIFEVLNDDAAGSRSVIGIDMYYEDQLNISERALQGMSSLQFLRVKSDHNILNLSYISPKLQLIDWEYFPMTCLHFIVNTEFLVELIMCYSKLEKLWEGNKSLRNLKWMDLSYSNNLKELPNLSTASSLEKLNLSHCSSLVSLPSSIGKATNLCTLTLCHCTSLVELPSSIGNLTNLQILDLDFCSRLMKLPSSIGNATSLQKLDLICCSRLVKLPSFIRNATNLQELNLGGCLSLVELPSSIENSTNLKKLDLRKCSSLVELPSCIGNFIKNQNDLDLSGCSNLLEVPSSIGDAINLKKINFNGCSSLVKLPSSIGSATNLEFLDFSGCSSLVEVPASIGNLLELQSLIMNGCSKLEVLPVNVNLKSLDNLDLSGCSSLKSFPKISTNISYLNLSGTAIEEVPSSIRLWSRLETLDMSYCEHLKEFSHVLDNITYRDTEIQEVDPLVQGFSCLSRLILMGCKELVSLPQLPYSLTELNAKNCESLERVDCSFLNPKIVLNFGNCFKLNKEARDLIIQKTTHEVTVLPSKEIPTYFTHRANGGSLIVKLNKRPFSSSLIFKACILLVNKNEVEVGDADKIFVDCRIMDKNNTLKVPSWSNDHKLPHPLTEHLYIFGFKAVLTSNELSFEFGVNSDEWVIKECGFIEILKPEKKK